MQRMRNDESAGLFWQKVSREAGHKEVADPQLPRRRRMPKCYQQGDATPEYHDGVEEFYRQIYFQGLDSRYMQIVSNCF